MSFNFKVTRDSNQNSFVNVNSEQKSEAKGRTWTLVDWVILIFTIPSEFFASLLGKSSATMNDLKSKVDDPLWPQIVEVKNSLPNIHAKKKKKKDISADLAFQRTKINEMLKKEKSPQAIKNEVLKLDQEIARLEEEIKIKNEEK